MFNQLCTTYLRWCLLSPTEMFEKDIFLTALLHRTIKDRISAKRGKFYCSWQTLSHSPWQWFSINQCRNKNQKFNKKLIRQISFYVLHYRHKHHRQGIISSFLQHYNSIWRCESVKRRHVKAIQHVVIRFSLSFQLLTSCTAQIFISLKHTSVILGRVYTWGWKRNNFVDLNIKL